MGRPVHRIPYSYAGCGLIVDNNILIVPRTRGSAKYIVYYPETLYRPAFQAALHET